MSSIKVYTAKELRLKNILAEYNPPLEVVLKADHDQAIAALKEKLEKALRALDVAAKCIEVHGGIDFASNESNCIFETLKEIKGEL